MSNTGWIQAGDRETRRLAATLKTEGTAWDVANGILFLASDESRWITGVVLPIDAGVSAMSTHFQKGSPSAMHREHRPDWEAETKGQSGADHPG